MGCFLVSLLDECIVALGENSSILNNNEGNKIFDSFQEEWPITSWGRIDWEKIENKIVIDSIVNIKRDLESFLSLKSLEHSIYILWDEGTLPVLKASLTKTLDVIDDVTAVSFDTWFYCPSLDYVIEFYHEGEITIGKKSKKN